MNHRKILLIAVTILPLFLVDTRIEAQDQITALPPVAESKLQLARDQLQQIQQSLIEKRQQLDQLREQHAQLTDGVEREDLQKQISEEEAEMSALRRSFENIALGGVDSSVFDPARQSLQFNWQQELQLILEPLFQKMKDLTEKPRQIEQFKNRIALLDTRHALVTRALENLEQLRSDNMDAATLQWLDMIKLAWTQQFNDIQRDQNITRLRLNVMLDAEDTILERVQLSLNQFITGSGRNLALSMAAFVATLLLMKGVFYLYNRLGRRNSMLVSTSRRLLTYGYQALTFIVATIAAMMVLYLLSDLMLLVITAIILVLILLGLRNKLPMFVEESRLLLDVGSVREHERVLYRDLPWLVRSLGVYSYLHNPALEGLLRLPISEMMGLISRPCKDDEPWFPTSTGDWVMLDNGVVGQVLRQTPETVQIRSKGSILSFPTANFLGEPLRNLSKGFGISVSFGIDYQHQAVCTTEIPVKLRKSVEQALKQSDFAKLVENILVEFQDAGASSLNYMIYVVMKGEAADSYFAVSRLLQKTCVDCCNANDWVIPFNQLTLNAGTGFVDLTILPGKDLRPGPSFTSP